MVEQEMARLELSELEFDATKGKVDHTPRGSKDVADGIAGALYAAEKSRVGAGRPGVPHISGPHWGCEREIREHIRSWDKLRHRSVDPRQGRDAALYSDDLRAVHEVRMHQANILRVGTWLDNPRRNSSGMPCDGRPLAATLLCNSPRGNDGPKAAEILGFMVL